MEDYFKEVNVGDELLNVIEEDKKEVLEVFAKSEDEVLLTFTQKNNAIHASLLKGEVVIGNKTSLNGITYHVGEKIKLITKNGKTIELFINYIIGKDALVLSTKKKPSFSSLGWILKMFSNHL